MDTSQLREYALKTLDGGVVGDVGHVKSMTPGASTMPRDEFEALLEDLEDEGLAVCNSRGEWRSAHPTRLAGEDDAHGSHRRVLAYIPSVDPDTFLHLSYWEDLGNYQLRRYVRGERVRPFKVPGVEDIFELRAAHPIAEDCDYSGHDARNVHQVDYWAEEIEKLDKRIPEIRARAAGDE